MISKAGRPLFIRSEDVTKEEALEYCYKHQREYEADNYTDNRSGAELFECLIAILEDGTILPSELADYGMEY